jgi:hypothetical protein
MPAVNSSDRCACDECQKDPTGETAVLHDQMRLFASTLDEKQKRLFAGWEANQRSHGGQKLVAKILGLSTRTVRRGQQELKQVQIASGVRKPGGGRKQVEKKSRHLEATGGSAGK